MNNACITETKNIGKWKKNIYIYHIHIWIGRPILLQMAIIIKLIYK